MSRREMDEVLEMANELNRWTMKVSWTSIINLVLQMETENERLCWPSSSKVIGRDTLG